MSDQEEFAVGDLVRFKPEHYGYRDRQKIPNEFVVAWVGNDGMAILRTTMGIHVYSHRVEAASGPW